MAKPQATSTEERLAKLEKFVEALLAKLKEHGITISLDAPTVESDFDDAASAGGK